MKGNKERFLDVILEIILYIVIFSIGALILWLFGVSLDSQYVDFETIVLIGIVVPILIFAISSALLKKIKKIFRNKKQSKQDK